MYKINSVFVYLFIYLRSTFICITSEFYYKNLGFGKIEQKWKDSREEDKGSYEEREQLKSLEEDQRGEFQPSEMLTDLTLSR